MKYWIYLTLGAIVGLVILGAVAINSALEWPQITEKQSPIYTTDKLDPESSITGVHKSTCSKRVYTVPSNPKYDSAALDCVDESIKNCELPATTFTYELGSLRLSMDKKEAGKCLMIIASEDVGDFGVRNFECEVPLSVVQDWKSWRNPDRGGAFKDITDNYCYATPVELTGEQVLAMQNINRRTIFESSNCPGVIEGYNVIDGTSDREILRGTPTKDFIIGRGGNDIIKGMDDDDCIVAGDGDDTIEGGLGNDLILGQDGNDSLDGGSGIDTCDGGSGANTIVNCE